MSGGVYDPGAAAEPEEDEEAARPAPAAPAPAPAGGPVYDPLAAPAAAEEEEAEDEDSDFEEGVDDPAGEGAVPGGQPAVRFRNYQPDGADALGATPYDPTATKDRDEEEEDEEEEEGEDEGEQRAAKRAKVDHPGPGTEANGGGEEENEEDEEEEEEEDAEDEPPKKEVKFRNYNPRDKELKAAKVKRPKEVVDDGDLSAEIQAEDAKPKPEGEDSLASLLPQKRDHDLRKLVEPKLQLLQRRTQKVLLRIIQDRIKQQEQEEGEGEEMEEDEDAEEDVPA